MQSQIDQVRMFHRVHGFSEGLKLEPARAAVLPDVVDQLDVAAKMLLAQSLDPKPEDIPTMRGHLILEEAGFEAMHALMEGDELKLLDALGDGCYVIFGTAVAFDLPLAPAFNEIHLSNMTKVAQEKDPNKARVRDKGPWFMKPNLEHILARHRGHRTGPTLLEALDEVRVGLGKTLLECVQHGLTAGQVDTGIQNRIGFIDTAWASLCQALLHAHFDHPGYPASME